MSFQFRMKIAILTFALPLCRTFLQVFQQFGMYLIICHVENARMPFMERAGSVALPRRVIVLIATNLLPSTKLRTSGS